MKSLKSLLCIFMLFILCFVHLCRCVSQNEADVTNTTSNPPVDQSKGIETYSAAEMCSNYSQLIYKYTKDSKLSKVATNVNDERTAPKEFLHMALLGDSNGIWLYSGSLISNRWILSVAHFEGIFYNLTRWARLRDPNYLLETDDATPMDYQIDEIVVHPDFQIPSLYNDIALFHLDRDVEFSSYVRPICLNADPNWQSNHPQTMIAPGWGRILYDGPWKWDALNAFSSGLLKVSMDIVSADLCKSNYNVSSDTPQLRHGIVEDMIICAGVVDGEEDTCVGFGGSSLQIAHPNYTSMYTQVGISSAGKERCATKDFPFFYTRVSKYLPWIERIVWPKSG